jgi:hypothetical protein
MQNEGLGKEAIWAFGEKRRPVCTQRCSQMAADLSDDVAKPCYSA